MQWVIVTQELRTSRCKSSLTQVEPTGQERTRVPPRQGPYAAGGSEKAGRVLEPRKVSSCGARGQPTVCQRRQAAVLGALWRVRRTPPGSESGAGLQRGSSGTWESHVSPGVSPGLGERVTTSPGVVWGPRPGHTPVRETTHAGSRPGIGTRATREATGEGPGGRRRVASSRGRWGRETQATPGRAGDVGHSVPWADTRERLCAHPSCHPPPMARR